MDASDLHAESTPVAEARPDEPNPSGPFPIVGVGASAGGLEAFTELLAALPPNPGMALLFILHLEPHHKSQLVEILSKISPLKIHQAAEGMTVEADHVYVIPPNTNMALADGTLALTPRSPARGLHMPIDHLFRSLAGVQRRRAIGVLLSGGGTDGTLGFQSIKAEGGITFAQDDKTARQDSMPRSAIGDGHVDYVLPPSDIARELVRLVHHPYQVDPVGPDVSLGEDDATGQIVALLRSRTNVDFAHYRQTTIKRRIQRRMALRGLENVQDYITQLRADPDELRALYQDFLIRVTQFFRDPEAFEALKEKVFPTFVAGRPANSPIRIWVAGCSTGEEVYSLAIALLEYLGTRPEAAPVKILATDLSEAALEKARIGLYIDNIEIDVSPERLRRFFLRVNGHYQISKMVRDLCVFSRHNMASDPPFSHLDLVSCRNVLIYMDLSLQRRVLPVLHYALNPGGFLFLGVSENIGPFAELFEVVDPRHRLFSKKARLVGGPLDLGAYVTTEGHSWRSGRGEEVGAHWSTLDVQKEADRIVLARYAPVGVVIDEAMTVLQFRGRTAPYLEPAPGTASLDLLRMLREGLLAEVRGAINQAKAENLVVVRDAAHIKEGAERRAVRVEAIPFKVPPSGVRFFLVLFQEGSGAATPHAPPAPQPPATASATEQQVLELQQELTALREYLQSVIEEQESINEEVKSANEEILSANEELQSTNEELQTAKEESQSANEELATVNEELRHRNEELARVNNDLVNILSGVNIPIVMVDRDLRIRRFTPLAEKVYNLIPTDIGRPIGNIKPNLDVADLSQWIAQVIDRITPYECLVQDRDGRSYSLLIRPYVTLENKIDGASLVLLDIESVKRSLEQTKGAGDGDGEPPSPQ